MKRALHEGRIAQSLLMAGPRGVGKHQFALALAQALNCMNPVQGDACGTCLPCRKILTGDYSDVKTVVADGQFIKVSQTREILRETQFRPFEGRRRIYIFDDADRLREEAANSILKTLEEPPETSLFVLLSCKPYSLLPTIRSRCQLLTFAPIPERNVEAFLLANRNRTPEQARLLARLSRGSLGAALSIDLDQYAETRKIMLELLETLARHDTVRLLKAADYLGRKLERDEFESALDVLVLTLADVFHIRLGSDESITNADVLPRLRTIAEATTIDQIMEWGSNLELLQQGLSHNLNRQLAMEAAIISA